MLKPYVFLILAGLLPTTNAYSQVPANCPIDPRIYPTVRAAVDTAAQKTLAQFPNGSPDVLWNAYKAYLLSRLPDIRTLDPQIIPAYRQALAPSSDQAFTACYPEASKLMELYEKRLGATNGGMQQNQVGDQAQQGWIGVRIQEVTADLADALGLNSARGALVAKVNEGGPAENAGIEPGDVIVGFDDQDVKSIQDLRSIVRKTPVGMQVRAVIVRQGKEEKITVTVGDLANSDRSFESYVNAHGGCGFFSSPHDFNGLWRPDNATGAINSAMSSVSQGNIDIELFGKPLAEWSGDDVSDVLPTVVKCAPNLSGGFEQQLRGLIAAERKVQAERQAQQLKAQTESNNNAADEASGYRHVTIDSFVLDGKDLAAENAKLAISGAYLREGNLDNLYANRPAAYRDSQGYAQPKVPILTDNATRDFRQQQLNCLASPASDLGCPVTVLGHATTCKLTNAFGVEREGPCVDVEDGRFSSGP